VLLSRVSLEIEYAEVKIRRSGGAKPLEEITGGQITIEIASGTVSGSIESPLENFRTGYQRRGVNRPTFKPLYNLCVSPTEHLHLHPPAPATQQLLELQSRLARIQAARPPAAAPTCCGSHLLQLPPLITGFFRCRQVPQFRCSSVPAL